MWRQPLLIIWGLVEMTGVITFKGVSFGYIRGVNVVEDINLNVEQGEFLGIVGPNGSGKTTLLKLILGLLHPDKGSVRVLAKSPELSRHVIGYVPQFKTFPHDFPISVEKTVLMGRLGRTNFLGGYTSKDKSIARQMLEELEVSDLVKEYIGKLSGGQLQRVLIARALACEPEILLLDEPTASVDPQAEENIFDLLKIINKKVTIIIVSHDIGFISDYIQRVACLNKTMVCHRTSELTAEIIEELYGGSVRMISHDHVEKE